MIQVFGVGILGVEAVISNSVLAMTKGSILVYEKACEHVRAFHKYARYTRGMHSA